MALHNGPPRRASGGRTHADCLAAARTNSEKRICRNRQDRVLGPFARGTRRRRTRN